VGSNPTPRTLSCTPEFFEYLRGRVRETTAESYCTRIKVLSKLGNLDNPEKMKTLICTYSVSEARKELLTNAYDYYLKFRELAWDKPRFIREDKAFFLPTEEELGFLTSNARSVKMSTFLQFLKETACDSGEAWKLKWIDIDAERKTVNITPTKNHNARTLPISDNLLSRLLRLERKNERVFASKDLDSFSRCYALMRNRLSIRLNNPRIHLVAFRSFRHWKATDLYHKTKDILYVKWFLGHKRLENTLVYTHLIPIKEDQYICRIAKSVEEATQLIEQGFEYVTDIESAKIFRKRK
jgi:integrase